MLSLARVVNLWTSCIDYFTRQARGLSSIQQLLWQLSAALTNLVPRACVTLIQRTGNADQKDRSLWERDCAFNTNETKGSFSIVLTNKPRLHVAVNEGGLARGRNCNNSYCNHPSPFSVLHKVHFPLICQDANFSWYKLKTGFIDSFVSWQV